jgi:hypothetical protein
MLDSHVICSGLLTAQVDPCRSWTACWVVNGEETNSTALQAVHPLYKRNPIHDVISNLIMLTCSLLAGFYYLILHRLERLPIAVGFKCGSESLTIGSGLSASLWDRIHLRLLVVSTPLGCTKTPSKTTTLFFPPFFQAAPGSINFDRLRPSPHGRGASY